MKPIYLLWLVIAGMIIIGLIMDHFEEKPEKKDLIKMKKLERRK